MLYEQVRQGGDEAFAVLLAEKLPQLLETSVAAVEGVDIDRVVVLDGGSGTAVGNAVNQRVHGALGTLDALSSAVGIDIQEVLQGAAKKVGGRRDTA
jgi:flotillin